MEQNKQDDARIIAIPAGTLFTLSCGEWSDYSVITLCRALRDLDVEALRAEYLATRPEQAEQYGFDPYGFTKWLLVDQQAAEELGYMEWHLGGYGNAVFAVSENLVEPCL